MAGGTGARGDLAVHAVEGGLLDLSFDAPAEVYARQLSRYITCASTIQSHVRRNYGVTFKLADISAMQAAFGGRQAARRAANDKIQPLPEDRNPFRVAPSREIRAAFEQKLPTSAPIRLAEETLAFMPPPMLTGEVIAAVAKEMGVTTGDVTGRSRLPKMVKARMMVAYVLHKRGNSMSAIGRKIGRDHSSVVYLVHKFEDTATDAMHEVAARYIEGRGA